MKVEKDISDVADAPLIPIIVGVTGHRDLRGEDRGILEERVREIFAEIRTEYPDTPLVVMSPLADGADRLVAKVALEEIEAGRTGPDPPAAFRGA